MDWRFILVIGAVLMIFVSMGKNPFEPPEGYIPPDAFKDGIRDRINGTAGGIGAPGGFSSFGGSGAGASSGFPNNNNASSGFSGLIPTSPSVTIDPNSPALGHQNNALPQGQYGGMGGSMQQQQGIATMPQLQNTVPAPVSPQSGNAYTGQQNIQPNYADPRAQPVQPPALQQPQAPSPFESLPSPGSKLELPAYIPRFQDTMGRQVAFAGSNVYTTDAEGFAVLMDDGVYALDNGRTITVQNGQHMWPKNANKF